MEKEFIPYNEALALKGLGFDEPCLGYYIELRNPQEGILTIEKCENNFDGLLAPTFSQAFRLFREKYGIKTYVYEVLEERFVFVTYTNPLDYKMSSTYHTTYEEAELECLIRLIELVKISYEKHTRITNRQTK